MCYFICQAQKLPIFAVFTSFLILCKIKNGGQDGDHLSRRHRPPVEPPKYTSSCGEDQTLGGGSITPLPPPVLVHGEGMTLCVRPRVNFIIDSAS